MPGDKVSGLAALGFPAVNGRINGVGFSLESPVKQQHGITADDNVVGILSGHCLRFCGAERKDDLAWWGVVKRGDEGVFVDVGGVDDGIHPG